MYKYVVLVLALVLGLTMGANPAKAVSVIILNEFLFDPTPGGDANGDGAVDVSADEFVELVNGESTSVDMSGWTLSDSSQVRHVFAPSTVLCPGCAILVFGGGTVNPNLFPGVFTVTASTGGLSLNNSADSIILEDTGAIEVFNVNYNSCCNGTSLTLSPDLNTAGPYQDHSVVSSSMSPFSPGTLIDGSAFAPVPIPPAVWLFGSGLLGLVGVARRKKAA